MTEQLDAVIIGTGQAGKPLASALAEAGWRAAIIERGRVGGTCIIDGCTPTKTMIASARVAHLARRAREYGVEVGPVEVDMEAVRARKRAVVDSFSEGGERNLGRHETLELVYGEARFEGPRTVAVELREGGVRRISAPHVFINVGARATVPALPGLADVPFLDNASVMELDRAPSHLLILGGGWVGLEFGQMFRRFGARVTVIEQGPRLAPREDEDIAAALTGVLEEDGLAIRAGQRAERVRLEGRDIVLTVSGGTASAERAELAGSHLLVAVGRTPNTHTLDLDRAGIETDERGYIPVSERLETNVPGVYALGDVNGGPPFTHVAYDDFRVVRGHLLGGEPRTTRDRMVPWVVFTDPELGRVGLGEREAREAGYDVKVASLPMSRVARAIEGAETRGLMKAVVDGPSGRVLGAAVLGVAGGEILSVLQVAMMGGLPWTALRDGVFAHPTLAESLNNLFATI